MNIEWNSEAEEEFLQLPDNLQKKIKAYIQKLPEKGLNWDRVGFIEREDIGLEVYRIKIMPENDEGLNHRVVFDIEGRKYVIYKVGPRPGFYDEENLRQVEKRI